MGHPGPSREVERRFWRSIRAGVSISSSAAVVGVSESCARRWFRDGGGMPSVDLGEPTGRYLSRAEREEIAVWRAERLSIREMGRRLGRPASTIMREIARNHHKGRPDRYRAGSAQYFAKQRARRPKPAKLASCPRLRDYVAARLSGPHHYSPEQISYRLRMEFPDDEQMRVSHETIYQALYVQSRGALRRELTRHLRTGRAVRKPQRRGDARQPRQRVPAELLISARPAEAADRAVPGHWEGDLIVGAHGRSAVGTLVERSTRFTLLLHLPDGHGPVAVRDAICATIGTLPQQLRRSLTWDQGVELARHVEIRLALDLAIYFCDPHSPWQRGSNENTNGLLRQYLPKGTDLSTRTSADLDQIAFGLNGRPRKTLGWQTPAEALARLHITNQNPPVATTG